MSKVEKVAEIISAHVQSNGGVFNEPLFNELAQKKGFVAEPIVYQFLSLVRTDPVFKSNCFLSPEEVLWLFRMYANMKGRVDNWVRPPKYPITAKSARDVWYAHRGLDPKKERSRSAAYARSVCAEKRAKERPNKAKTTEPPPPPATDPGVSSRSLSGESEELLERLKCILGDHTAVVKELTTAKAFISDLLPLMEDLEAAFEMGREGLAGLRARAVSFLSEKEESTKEPQPETATTQEVPKGPMFETSPPPDDDLHPCFESVCETAQKIQHAEQKEVAPPLP